MGRVPARRPLPERPQIRRGRCQSLLSRSDAAKLRTSEHMRRWIWGGKLRLTAEKRGKHEASALSFNRHISWTHSGIDEQAAGAEATRRLQDILRGDWKYDSTALGTVTKLNKRTSVRQIDRRSWNVGKHSL